MTASRRRAPWPAVLLAAALLASALSLAWVAYRGPGEPSSMQERVRSISATLRCPVCQNLSVADSSSQLAREMRGQIARDLRAGKSPADIRDEFVAAYGEWILLGPSASGINLAAWFLPMLLLLGGLAAAGLAVRRWSQLGGGAEPPAAADARTAPLSRGDRRLLDRELSRAGEEPE